MVDISTNLTLFNILISKGGVRIATKNTLVTDLAITMFYNLQNASFLHISSPVNAIEDSYVTFGHFVKIKRASKIADSRFIMEMPYFPRFALFFIFLEPQNFICQKIVDISTNLTLFNILISKSGI